MDILLVLPIIIPFSLAIIAVLAWGRPRIQRFLALGATVSMLLVALALLLVVQQNGIQMTRIGSWPAPFGIIIVADLLSAIMVVMAALVGLTVVVYSFASMDEQRESFGYYPALLFILMGVCGAFLTGDLFNLYVWFEIVLISSFLLLSLGGTRAQLEGSIKYFALNMLISAFFLSGVGFLYSITGSLNMADLARVLPTIAQPGLVTVVAMFFLVAFGIKAASFPFYFWLPAAYHTPPIAVTTLFSGLMTKVGVYAMLRIFTLIFTQDTAFTHNLILIMAGFTMVTGVLGAVAQYEVRRLLSFHIISQIGYLLMGLGLFTVSALAGAIFFMVHVIIAKAALFLVSGIMNRVAGSYDLNTLGGLYKSHVGLAALFLIPAFSLAGFPPLSGFWAKFTLVRAALEEQQIIIALVALGVGMLTLFSMTKIWAAAFWKDRAEDTAAPVDYLSRAEWRSYYLPVIALAVLTISIGVLADPVYQLATQAATQLSNPEIYIEVVLGSAP